MDVLTSATNQLTDINSNRSTTIEPTCAKPTAKPAVSEKMTSALPSTNRPWREHRPPPPSLSPPPAEPPVTENKPPLVDVSKSSIKSINDNLDNTSQPICQNCSTINTPLWRRDENGHVLCNACGLFLKLHGRARPISLKTDVIKSRNRVKTNQINSNKLGSRSAGSSPALEPSSPGKSNGNGSYVRKSKPSAAGLGRFRSTILTPGSIGSGEKSVTIKVEEDQQQTKLGSNLLYMFRTHDQERDAQDEANSAGNLSDIPHTVTSPLLLPSTSSKALHPLPRPLSSTSLPNYSDIDMDEKPALAALSAAVQAASSESGMRNHSTSGSSNKSPNMNASTTILDQLTAAAAASPYLSPHQPESDTRETVRNSTLNVEMSKESSRGFAAINSVSPLNSPKSVDSASLSSHDHESESHMHKIMLLKTRVSELELVNDLLRSRVSELEVSESAARRCENAIRESEALSRKYTATLEGKVSDLERQLAKLVENNNSPAPKKRARLSDIL